MIEQTVQWDVHNCEGNMCSKLEYIFRVSLKSEVDCVWNVMAHAQKPDFVFQRNGRLHLNRQGALVQSTTDSRVVRISGSNAWYTMFRSSLKSIGYPLHSPVSPFTSPPACQHISTGLYINTYLLRCGTSVAFISRICPVTTRITYIVTDTDDEVKEWAGN